ncbi:hypothetical protein LMF32_00860 [Desemzia sp. C1]|uniref:hypothetical protein n=1 Tax=Desemzia sp. C1 TaxID=2892016 RepID=UPI001E367F89|nr:hypothetical protein [Desemzia sp. C1]MCI3027686.1 hypothetical protein [Desemzia sp. C1]
MATSKELKELEVKNAIPAAEKTPMKKFGVQEKKEVAGIEYTLQFPGVRAAQRILDSSKQIGGIFNDEAYNSQIMESVIVEPKVDWDYWDEHEGYRELMAIADNFLGRMLK